MPAGDFYPRPPRGGRPSCRPGSDPAKRISIHALREEGDRAGIPPSMRVSEFLSTPSTRRATRRWLGRGSGTDYFYPRPPRGGRLIMSNHQDSGDLFLSTPSARRATCKYPVDSRRYFDFYPRPPRGGRQPYQRFIAPHYLFLSTPSARRATLCALDQLADQRISIHALREEGDAMVPMISMTLGNFYPRPPRGGRRLP